MRARNIKPGFFANVELLDLDPLTRLLFAGLWLMADREGRLMDRPRRIKIELLPADNCDVDAMLGALAAAELVTRYEVAGVKYLQVNAFSEHQNPHCNEKLSEIPPPPGQRNKWELQVQSDGKSRPVVAQCWHSAAHADSGFRIPDSGCQIPDPGLQQPPACVGEAPAEVQAAAPAAPVVESEPAPVVPEGRPYLAQFLAVWGEAFPGAPLLPTTYSLDGGALDAFETALRQFTRAPDGVAGLLTELAWRMAEGNHGAFRGALLDMITQGRGRRWQGRALAYLTSTINGIYREVCDGQSRATDAGGGNGAGPTQAGGAGRRSAFRALAATDDRIGRRGESRPAPPRNYDGERGGVRGLDDDPPGADHRAGAGVGNDAG